MHGDVIAPCLETEKLLPCAKTFRSQTIPAGGLLKRLLLTIMKIKNLLTLAALTLPLAMFGRPANPNIPVRMTNPDGSVVEVYAHGDERFNYFTLADGQTIVEKDAKGFWKNAVRSGVQMMASRPADLKVLKAEIKPFDYSPVNEAGTRMAPIDEITGRTKFPTIANDVHSLVVLIEFSDTPFTVPNIQQTITDMLNKEGYDAYGSRGSARDYYSACSAGKFTPIFDVSPVVKLSHSAAYYVGANSGLNGAGKNARFGEAIEEALKYLDEQGMDFSKYDYDGDGDIDTVFFFYSGYGQADSHLTNTIWPHQADFSRYVLDYEGSIKLDPLYLDGKRLGPYACSNELNYVLPAGAKQPYLDGIGAFVHEFGHVLGLPDLYDTNNGNTKTPGEFSVMDHGSYNDFSVCPPIFTAWEKWVCHWLEYDDVDEQAGAELTIPSLSKENKATRIRVRIPRPGTFYYDEEYYVLESRDNTDWDQEIPDHGMLIWHINFNHNDWVNNTVNVKGKPRVEIMNSQLRPSRYVWGTDINTSYVEPSMDTALIPENRVLTSGDNAYAIYLSNIKFDEESGSTTLRFNLDKEVSDVKTTMLEPYHPEGTPEKTFVLRWNPVEGADGYYLTLFYKSPSGAVTYINEYNNTWVGNKTSVTVDDYFSSLQSSDLHAFVRVKKVYPSPSTSDEIVFVPNNLKTMGVETIGDEMENIFGGNGEIIAPEGAEFYNLGGMRVAGNDLPAGIYIVKYAGKASKVVVR